MLLTNEQQLLICLARTYCETLAKFGQHGQPTYLQFPRIQGSRMDRAIQVIADVDYPIPVIDIEAILKSLDAAVARPSQTERDHARTRPRHS